MVMMPSTVPLAMSNVTIRWLAAVMVAFVQPSGTLSSHETKRVPPCGTGFELWAQASEPESMVVRQCTPPVESVSMMGLWGAREKNVQVM
jgi:hypothetical protein